MKCEKCGYIFNGDFDKCPYCGTSQGAENQNLLHSTVPLGQHNSIRIRTILMIIFLNLFLVSFFVDWLVFNFQYRITLFSYLVCFGAVLITAILYAPKSPLSIFERIDFYLIVGIIIAAASLKLPSFDGRVLFGFVVLPIYLLVTTLLYVLLLSKGKGKKFRPIVTEFAIIGRLLLAIACLVIFLVGVFSASSCKWALMENLVLVQKITIYGAFGIMTLLFLNFNLLLILNIFNRIKYIYGK